MHTTVSREMNLLSELKKSTAGKQVVQSLVFRLAGLALIFLLHVMLARLMGPKQYGNYIVIITVINILMVVSLFGLDSSTMKFLPAYVSRNNFSAASGFVKFARRTVMLLAVICSVLLFIFLLTKAKKFGSTLSEGYFWGILLLPFLALIYQSSAILRALNKYKSSLIPVFFLLPITTGVICLYYYNSNNHLNVDAAMLIYLCSTMAVCYFTVKKAKKAMRDYTTEDRSYVPKEWLSVSGILFLTTSLDLLLRQSDILMVSYFMNNTNAGYYAVAARLATLTALGLSVADYVFMPKISALYEGRQLLKLQDLVKNASLQILSITLPILFTLIIGGKWILGLFGPQYADAYLVLVILLCGQIVNSFTGMVGGLMTMTGHQRAFLILYVLAFGIQISLNIILIPSFGITGAAIGTAVSMIVLNLLAYFFVKSKLKIKASFF